MNMEETQSKEDLTELKVDHDSAIPLHIQVESLLRMLIAQKVYQDGKLLPKEVDLSKRLGISRNTIRQATNKLVHEQLLTRKKGVGTRVASQRLTTGLDNWYSFSQEMQEQGMELVNHRVSVSTVKADELVAQALEISEGKKVICLERLRGFENEPIVLFKSYFHPRIGLTGEENFNRHLYDILEKDYNTIPAISKEEISAMLADEDIGTHLDLDVGDPVLHRKRIVCDPGKRPLEYNLCFYRADKFKYSINIKRD